MVAWCARAKAPIRPLPSSLRVVSEPGPRILLVEPFIRSDTRTLGLIVGVTATAVTVGMYTGGLE
jgi:hypothetical protein